MLDAGRWRSPLIGGGLALLVLGAAGFSIYTMSALTRERRRAEEAAAANQALNSSLRQMQSQLGSMSEQLRALTAAPSAAPVPPSPAPVMQAQPHVRSATIRKAARATAPDPQWKQIQARLADQQKQIADTRLQVDQTRQDLTGTLSSTKDELNGSIARNHEQLATLEKRGERKYYEFQLGKSKEFQRVGPLSISVRKVDFKHKYYDLHVMVDDRQLEKKHVNLYEPLMLTLADRRQPIELVVNAIDKSEVKGYVSEPKYKESELANAVRPVAEPPALQRR